MKKLVLVLATLGSVAHAQTGIPGTNNAPAGQAPSSPATVPTATSGQLSTTVDAPTWRKSVVLGYKSMNDTGRFGMAEQTTKAKKADPRNPEDADMGRQYKGKHEIKAGYKHKTGWGAYGTMTQYRYDYTNEVFNKWSASDPSLTLTHPALYDNGEVKVMGAIRYYVPNTDRSKIQGVKQVSYYLDTIVKLPYGAELFNSFNPRIFANDTYKAYDSRMKVEDLTSYTRKIGSWGRYGIGQWTQYEQHAQTPQAWTVDLIPQLDVFIDGSKTFIGPRVYLPVVVRESLYDGARAVATDNAYFELYFQANL